MKFPFNKCSRVILWDCFGELDTARLATYIGSIKDGKKMELIIREKIDWNADQMKKYFEGPVVDFFVERYRDEGVAFGKGDVREGLLGRFLGWTEANEFGQKHALSRTTLDAPKDGKCPRTRWIEFLRDINAYCMDRFHCELPSANNVDIGD